jgi:hypothetical protein
MRDPLPVGALVQVTPLPVREERPYRGVVRGYDMSRSKYRIGAEYIFGLFADPGYSWVFPSEVGPITICTGDHHATYEAVKGAAIYPGERILDKTVMSRGSGTISVSFTNLVTGRAKRDPANQEWTLFCKSDVYLLGKGSKPRALPVLGR